MSLTFLNPGFYKTVLSDSGFYDNIVSSGLKLASVKAADSEEDKKIIEDLKPVIEKVLTPSFLKATTETVIDGFGDWIKGKQATPSFKIDLSSVKTQLNNSLAGYLHNRVAALPDCQQNNDKVSYDLVTTACKPPIELSQADFLAASANFSEQLPLFDQNEFSFNLIDKDGTFTNNQVAKNIPTVFRLLQALPVLFGISAAIALAVIVWLTEEKSRAFRFIGHTFLVVGAFLLVCGAITIFYLGRNFYGIVGQGSPEQTSFIEEIFYPISNIVSTTYGKICVYFGTAYSLIGSGCYIWAHRLKIKKLRNTDFEKPKILPNQNEGLSQINI